MLPVRRVVHQVREHVLVGIVRFLESLPLGKYLALVLLMPELQHRDYIRRRWKHDREKVELRASAIPPS